MNTKHRFLTTVTRARVRSTPCPNVLLQARLAPRSTAYIQTPKCLSRQYTAPAIAVQEYEARQEMPSAVQDEFRTVGFEDSAPRMESWTSALTNSLNDLNDEEVIEVLEEALRIPQESTSRSTTAALAALESSLPANKPFRSAVSLVTLVLAIRSRPTYRHILSTIRPHVFAALLDHLIFDIGVIHLVHLLLNDILTRSFGRLDIVREALVVCCRAYSRENDAAEKQSGAGHRVNRRYVLALLGMLDDSHLEPWASGASEQSRQLDRTTVRSLLEVISEPTAECAVDEARLLRLFKGFFADNKDIRSPSDVHLAQRTMMYASMHRQHKAAQAMHEVLLQRGWILDEPIRHSHNTYHHIPLGLSIALIRMANTSLQLLPALEWTNFALTHNLVKPHSRLRAAFSQAVDEAFRCVIATRDAAAMEEMAKVAAAAIASKAVAVNPRVIERFYGVCDEHEQRGTMRRLVRKLWERGVATGKVGIDDSALDPFFPTGRPLAHLLEYMYRKATPWTGDDARMLDWFLGRLRDQPVIFMDSTTIGRCVAAICAFPKGLVVARHIYEKVQEDPELGLRPRYLRQSRGIDAELAKNRICRALLTDSYAMSRLVKGTTSGAHPDTAFATAVVHRYIQYSPPLAELSNTDLARLTGAFFRIGNVDAGLRMLKYLDGRPEGMGDKAISVLQGALKMVPSTAGTRYLELLEMALDRSKGEVGIGSRLLKNLVRKGGKALEFVEDKSAMGRLAELQRRWENRNAGGKT
ncbi:hypothetical protein NliqN6_1555 [Naganishia liquefaciens]|uniref:Uncharacterized protein n=1 Tax=Naganishia liquefaciens TaxID=104408 RepID=A0A8H3TQ92_9TREE|nr:hypothetical protein NliqN6_1555 [Naganishia liquefaciens]